MLKYVSRRNRIADWCNKRNTSLCAYPRVWGWVRFSWWDVSLKSTWVFVPWGANGWCREGVVESASSFGHGCLHPRWSHGIINWFDTFWTPGKIVYLRDKDTIILFACKQKEVSSAWYVKKVGHGTTVDITRRSIITWNLSLLHHCLKRH